MTNEKLRKPFKNTDILFDIKYILEKNDNTLIGCHVKEVLLTLLI